MKTISLKEQINDYKAFSESMLNEFAPETNKVVPGSITYEESYLVRFFAQRKQFLQELNVYLNKLLDSVDSPTQRNRLYKELSEISRAYYQKYTEQYIKANLT